MVILITGATHTGKTALAQKLMECCHYPYFSIDHLKMGLIRSGNTALTPMDDDKLTEYLWPVVREMVKTAIENRQNLIVEGCYIPFDWKKDFTNDYLAHIRYLCLAFSKEYIETHYSDILKYASIIEKRLDDACLDMAELIRENEENLAMCSRHGLYCLLMEQDYNVDAILEEYSNTGA